MLNHLCCKNAVDRHIEKFLDSFAGQGAASALAHELVLLLQLVDQLLTLLLKIVDVQVKVGAKLLVHVDVEQLIIFFEYGVHSAKVVRF